MKQKRCPQCGRARQIEKGKKICEACTGNNLLEEFSKKEKQ